MTAAQLESLRRHAEQEYPRECCGVLLGRRSGDDARVAEVVRCKNASSSPLNRYAVDPVDLIQLQRSSRERHLEIVGFYHSHPDYPAKPSERDLEDGCWTGCSYLIVAVARGRATEWASYLLRGGPDAKAFEAEDVVFEK